MLGPDEEVSLHQLISHIELLPSIVILDFHDWSLKRVCVAPKMYKAAQSILAGSPPPSIQIFRQRHSIESDILPAPLKEPSRAQRQRLLAQHVLAGVELAAVQWSPAVPVELPQRAVFTLHKANIVQVHVVGGLRRERITLAGG